MIIVMDFDTNNNENCLMVPTKVHTLRQGWAASVNLRKQSSVFRVVARFFYFFLLNNMRDWCFFKYMIFHRSFHTLLRFKDIRCI